MTFPDIRAPATGGNSLFLVTVILTVILFLALYRALRKTSLAAALVGSVLGVMGLVVHTISALPVVAFVPIADLYHAPGATPADQATLLLMWQATQGLINLLDAVGLLLITIGFIGVGVAMLRAPDFGKGFGGVSVVLGVLGVVGVSLFVVDPLSLTALAVAIPGFIVFPLLFGWKVYSLSRAT